MSNTACYCNEHRGGVAESCARAPNPLARNRELKQRNKIDPNPDYDASDEIENFVNIPRFKKATRYVA